MQMPYHAFTRFWRSPNPPLPLFCYGPSLNPLLCQRADSERRNEAISFQFKCPKLGQNVYLCGSICVINFNIIFILYNWLSFNHCIQSLVVNRASFNDCTGSTKTFVVNRTSLDYSVQRPRVTHANAGSCSWRASTRCKRSEVSCKCKDNFKLTGIIWKQWEHIYLFSSSLYCMAREETLHILMISSYA